MNFIKNKHKSKLYWFGKGLIKLIDAITPLVTLGFYWTDLEYKFTKWHGFK